VTLPADEVFGGRRLVLLLAVRHAVKRSIAPEHASKALRPTAIGPELRSH